MSDDLNELLELADGPVAMPADERADLRASVLATAAQRRLSGDHDALLPLHSAVDRPARSSPRRWLPLAAVAASVVVVIGAFVALNNRSDPVPDPAISTPIDSPPTLEALCAQARQDAVANGLIGRSSPSNAAELRRLADGLDELAARSGAGGSDLGGLAERVRLLAAAVEDEDGGVVINTRSAIGDEVEALFDPGAICGR